jgi:hypothetical protein
MAAIDSGDDDRIVKINTESLAFLEGCEKSLTLPLLGVHIREILRCAATCPPWSHRSELWG